MGSTPHLVQYQGSKRNLAKLILEYFPPKFNRLVEPFSGTAAITMACASRGMASEYIINDLNKPLIDLLKLVVENPEYVSLKYSQIWNDQFTDTLEHYYQEREIFNLTKDPVIFLYLLARCVKGAVRYNADGLFNQSPDKRRHGTQPNTMQKNIYDVSYILKDKAKFFSLDYKTILDSALPGDIVYMDPPYQGVCGERDSRYFAGISHDEFVNELRKLSSRKISYIVSYDGKLGEKNYGEEIPLEFGLKHVYLNAGRSSQATLLGRDETTLESLYLTADLFSNLIVTQKETDNGLFSRVS
jgi:DNA adenine methylase